MAEAIKSNQIKKTHTLYYNPSLTFMNRAENDLKGKAEGNRLKDRLSSCLNLLSLYIREFGLKENKTGNDIREMLSIDQLITNKDYVFPLLNKVQCE